MKSIKTMYDSRKKKIMIGSVLLIFLITASVFFYNQNKATPNLVLKDNVKDIVIVEYGEKVKVDLNTYLNFEGIDKKKKEEMLKNAKLDIQVENEKDKEYPAIGKYDGTITYQKEKVEIKIEIKDTTSPKFEEIETITFEEGTDFNYKEVIKASDLQEISYEIDDSQVDKNKVGDYALNVIAKDKSGNEAKKEFKVSVKEKGTVSDTPKENSTGSTTNNGGNNSNTSNGNSTGGSGSGGDTGGGSKPSTPQTPPQPSGPTTPEFQATKSAQILVQINAYRTQNGLNTLTVHSQLKSEADNHTYAMAQKRALWHSGVNVECITNVPDAFSAWKNSPAHNNIMLSNGTYGYVSVYLIEDVYYATFVIAV